VLGKVSSWNVVYDSDPLLSRDFYGIEEEFLDCWRRASVACFLGEIRAVPQDRHISGREMEEKC